MIVEPIEPIQIGPREITENELITTVVNQPIWILSPNPSEPTSEQRMRLLESSGALDFWSAPGEDIYSIDDGDPI